MPLTTEQLLLKIKELETRLEESDQLIEAIKAGEVDAFALRKNNQSEIFTLETGDYAYRMLVENFGEGALNLSENALVVYTNNYFPELLSLPYEDVIGNSFSQFIHPESIETFNELFKKGLAGQSKGEINLLARNKTIPVYLSLTSLYPQLPTVGMILTDFSEKKHQEKILELKNTELEAKNEMLKERNDFVETLINSSVDLIMVFDKEYRFLTANKTAVERFSKFYSKDILGKTLTEVVPNIPLHDIDLAFTGITHSTPVSKSLVSNKYYEITYIPLFNKNEVYAVMVISHDITEHIAREAQIKESEEKFNKIFHLSPNSMVLAEALEARFIMVNENFLKTFGFSREEIIGKTTRDLGISIPELRKPILDELNKTGSIQNVEVKMLHKKGELIPILLSVETIFMGNEKLFLGALNDITERKRTEQEIAQKNSELEKINKELKSFAYVSSHDLQEPLRKIQTFATIIAEKEAGNLSDQGKENFLRMQEAAKRMQTLILDLLAYSRTNTMERKFEKTDLYKIIEEVKHDLKEDLKDKQATIETMGLGEGMVIPFQFKQLMHNLIGNSLKFSNSGSPPYIKITTSIEEGVHLHNAKLLPQKKYCHITFSDNGIGFEQQYSEKIFEVFQRLHGREEYTGTGIGLSIVKKIVENHNGVIIATGEINKGATFDIYLPTLPTL